MWLPLLRQLAARPQGPPHRMRVTILDVLPRAMEGVSSGRKVCGPHIVGTCIVGQRVDARTVPTAAPATAVVGYWW